MATQSAADVRKIASAAPARLEPDAIGVAQDSVIGMASSAPEASVGLTLATFEAATACGSGQHRPAAPPRALYQHGLDWPRAMDPLRRSEHSRRCKDLHGHHRTRALPQTYRKGGRRL